mmetsp:Transcript_20214/g.21015  ORF Transcript_20214/g.21015 Transcript_20214/m.21015 type:complete len:199 (-) Transcript_20214:51-647(-)
MKSIEKDPKIINTLTKKNVERKDQNLHAILRRTEKKRASILINIVSREALLKLNKRKKIKRTYKSLIANLRKRNTILLSLGIPEIEVGPFLYLILDPGVGHIIKIDGEKLDTVVAATPEEGEIISLTIQGEDLTALHIKDMVMTIKDIATDRILIDIEEDPHITQDQDPLAIQRDVTLTTLEGIIEESTMKAKVEINN